MSIREPIAALTLEPSETAVLHAASRIFSALVVAGRLDDQNCDELVDFSVRTAVALARESDHAIESDGEVTRGALGG
jgi:hypothetical protein